jgi:radical SAM protein with 4Fe4S-binding SPASM domain
LNLTDLQIGKIEFFKSCCKFSHVKKDDTMPEKQFDGFDVTERHVVFLLTEKCNLDCIYCYEKNKNKNSKTLSVDFIKDKIRKEMSSDKISNKYWFTFFGGEPLFEFETICEVVDWFLKENWASHSKSVRFMADTNGTLLDNRMKKWFSTYRDHVTLSLSLDGTKSAHDLNRSNSYNNISRHFSFLRKNWPKQPVKMTIGPETIDQTYDGVLHIHSFGLEVEFDVLREDVWGDDESENRAVAAWTEQLQKLIAFYSLHPEIPRPKVLNQKIEMLFDTHSTENNPFCGAGKYLTCFTPDGIEYPCWRFSPLCVSEPLFDITGQSTSQNEICNSCPLVRICSTCPGNNYALTGSWSERTAFHCKFFKASLLATVRMLLIDHPEYLCETVEGESTSEKLQRMRKLLAIRLINDVCNPVALTKV